MIGLGNAPSGVQRPYDFALEMYRMLSAPFYLRREMKRELAFRLHPRTREATASVRWKDGRIGKVKRGES